VALDRPKQRIHQQRSARIIDDAYQRHHQDAFHYRHHRAGEFAHGRTEQLTLTH